MHMRRVGKGEFFIEVHSRSFESYVNFVQASREKPKKGRMATVDISETLKYGRAHLREQGAHLKSELRRGRCVGGVFWLPLYSAAQPDTYSFDINEPRVTFTMELVEACLDHKRPFVFTHQLQSPLWATPWARRLTLHNSVRMIDLRGSRTLMAFLTEDCLAAVSTPRLHSLPQSAWQREFCISCNDVLSRHVFGQLSWDFQKSTEGQ